MTQYIQHEYYHNQLQLMVVKYIVKYDSTSEFLG